MTDDEYLAARAWLEASHTDRSGWPVEVVAAVEAAEDRMRAAVLHVESLDVPLLDVEQA